MVILPFFIHIENLLENYTRNRENKFTYVQEEPKEPMVSFIDCKEI